MSKTIKDEINQAKLDLELSDDQIRLLPDGEGLAVYAAAEEHFIDGKNWTWWWEHFRLPSAWAYFSDDQGFRKLIDLVPSVPEKIWFIAEERRLKHFPVYETNTAVVQEIIGNCYGFECYLVAQDYRWLLGENHHSVLFAVGEPVKSNIEKLTAITTR